MIKIAPSILSADFSRLGEQIKEAEKAGADWFHLDIMDGMFVPNISFGFKVLKDVRKITECPLDVHLMIEKPERYIGRFAELGANIITVHCEACIPLYRTVMKIKEHGKKAGVALNPATSITFIEEVLPLVDMVLLMSVEPGFSGQKFIPSTFHKIGKLEKLLTEMDLDNVEIEVDGGINIDTIEENALTFADVNILVMASAIFEAKEGICEAIKKIRDKITDIEKRFNS